MSELTLSPRDADAVALSPQAGADFRAAPRMLNATAIPQQLRGLLNQPAVARALPLIGFIAVVGLAIAAWAALREPPQRDLFRGLPDADKAAVTAALDASNIVYALDSGTGAITVSEDDYYNAKIALAAQGLPKSAPSGDDMISSMPMGASRAVENEKLRAAREIDLARSIEALDAVVSARVHLAVEPPSIFIRDRNEPAASVVLHLQQAARLPESQVQAIVHLVASSVPGLSPDNVSVVDQNGRLLSSNGEGAGGMEEAERQLKVKESVEDRYRRQLVALLTPVLGADNFVAEVSADVDFTERQATSETFPADEARVRSEQRTFSSEPEAGEVAGIPGAIGNTPPAATTTSNTPPAAVQADAAAADPLGATPQVRNEQVTRSFELGRQVAVTREPSGTIKRLSVAVAVRNLPGGKQRSPTEIAAINALVKGAIGFNAGRGDQVAISSRNFETVPEAETPWYEADWVAMLVRNISALLVALAIVFGIGRPLLKRWSEKKAEAGEETRPSPLLAQAMARDGGNAPAAVRNAQPVTLDMINAAQSYQERALLIQNFVRQNPDHATLVVRDLLKSNDAKDAVNG